MQPNLPIDVDQQTGVWSTDGLPMLYVPRHFFNNLHLGIEQAIGLEAYAQMLYTSGYKSAYYWCEKESQTHSLEGVDVFRHYLKRLSQRGWGQFELTNENLEQGKATIKVHNSSFVLHSKAFQLDQKHNACYMFAGWWAGAADWVAVNQGWQHRFMASEVACAACDGSECNFELVQQQ